MQRICGPFCFENYHYAFQDTLSCDTRSLDLCILFKFIFLCLSRHSVLWHSLVRSLYLIQVYIFIPLIHSAPFLRCSHVLLYTSFFLRVLPRETFFLSLMTLLLGILLLFIISAVKSLILTIFFFLTFIVLMQLNFPWNISTNLLLFTNKASSHVVIV